jgi:hypothetical protein
VLEVAIVGKQVGLVRVDKPVAYLDIDDTGSSERVTVRKRDASKRDVIRFRSCSSEVHSAKFV